MAKLKRLSILMLAILGLYSQVNAQQKSIKFDTYTIEDGLSQSQVTSIKQDQFGYIWIATQDGLNRFNGYSFEIYKNEVDNQNSLPNNYVHMLLEDAGKNLWFGTNRGIAKINPTTGKVSKINRNEYPELKGYIFTHLAFDKAGKIWALSEKNGINIIDLNTKQVKVLDHINGTSVFSCLFTDKEKNIWIGTKYGQLFYAEFPYTEFKEVKNIELGTVGQINQFYQKSNNEIIVCSETGPFLISNKETISNLTEGGYLRYTKINCAYAESEDQIWLGSAETGLYLLKTEKNGDQNLFRYSKNPYNNSSIVDDNVVSIFEDNGGVIWVGTEKGVSKFDKYKQGFTTVSLNNNPDEGLIDYNVWSFAEDSMANIYIGTKKDLTIYSRDDQKFYHLYRGDNAHHYLLSIYVENPKTIWLGYDDGLYLLKINDLRFEDYSMKRVEFMDEEHSSNIRVYAIEQADDNRLWIGSRSGLSIINKRTLDYQFYEHGKEPNSIGDGSVKIVYRDLSNKLWVVTSNSGLYNMVERTDSSFYFKNYPIKNYSDNNGQITSILQTDKGTMWLGTYGEGLKKLDLKTKETVSYTEVDGLSNNVIYGLLEDAKHNIWTSTNKGLSKFNPTSEQFTTYSVKDGLQSNEFNTNAYMKSSKGLLYFGGINGYNIFDPSEININPLPPEVIISSVTLSTKGTNRRVLIAEHITKTKSLALEYSQNDITFEFISSSYSNPSKTRYKYILEGHEQEFTYLENENKVNYLNIPHGEYELKVYAQSADGVWSTNPTSVKIIITPPFWLTWWFRILALLGAILIGVLLYRRRIDKIRRQKVRLEIEVVKRTRQVTEQSKKIQDQKKRVEIQKAKIEHQNELLEKEKVKVEQLLLNILPEGTAEELKNKGRSKARYYRNVSVLFTDFVGFSKIAEDMKPQELVQQLDGYFSKFDEIIEKYDLEKIKTIGDSYMCAGGVPIRNKSNAIEVTLAALDINNYIVQRAIANPDTWRIRIGINTGEVIAGVIGIKRFAYDIWGATVNQAQRMEMHGQPGIVNVSGHTYEFIAPYFECSYRGKIQTKHKGMLDMYSVKGIKKELSEDGIGLNPNKKFWKIVDLHLYSSINYIKAERHIIKILETQLSPKLLYHSINHTLDVTQAVERFAIMEGITDEDLFLLKSAATYHDAGFIEKYDKNEEIGMRLAREILPTYGYTKDQIDIIDGLIKSTEIPQSPSSLLEQIMCDADLDYLGRDDFHEIADLLRRELREHGKLDSDKQWDEIQIKFLEQHTYFTQSAINLRQVKKLHHIEEIKLKLNTFDYKD
jgi:ligand-binding sensor domain-containing protein/class 3 adenylate cyclase/predicted metal-dependent HD superfamily phosphohydrolase